VSEDDEGLGHAELVADALTRAAAEGEVREAVDAVATPRGKALGVEVVGGSPEAGVAVRQVG